MVELVFIAWRLTCGLVGIEARSLHQWPLTVLTELFSSRYIDVHLLNYILVLCNQGVKSKLNFINLAMNFSFGSRLTCSIPSFNMCFSTCLL